MTTNEHKAAHEEALARLRHHIHQHHASGSTQIIKRALTDQPVKPSEIFGALDARNRNDLIRVMSGMQAYGLPDLRQPSPVPLRVAQKDECLSL